MKKGWKKNIRILSDEIRRSLYVPPRSAFLVLLIFVTILFTEIKGLVWIIDIKYDDKLNRLIIAPHIALPLLDGKNNLL